MNVLFYVALVVGTAVACTDFLASPGATVDGNPMISYSADSASVYGGLYYSPAMTYPEGTMLNLTNWITGKYIGQIPQANHTYNVIGNANEYGLTIGESTFGGLSALSRQTGALMDYGSLIYVALQRCKTAREAILTMTSLVEIYGYSSSGESFSIADANEVWVLEMIGKGSYEFGAVWVALRVPDGHVTAHANNARIMKFPRDDPDNCLYAPDVVSFAKEHGFYPADAKDEDFSFCDVYCPLTPRAARYSEMRVWSFFRAVGGPEYDKYKDFVSGNNLANRMPWSIQPAKKVDHRKFIDLMKDHYEGTDFDFTTDVGAGPYQAPYRWRPKEFTDSRTNITYANPRSISAPQTGWLFVAEVRPKMHYPLQALSWFAVDDAATSVFQPIYGAAIRVPKSLEFGGEAGAMNFSLGSAFWMFNVVAHMAYDRWNIIYPEILNVSNQLQDEFDKSVAALDKELDALAEKGLITQVIANATSFVETTSAHVLDVWTDLWANLTARHVDGTTKTPAPGKFPPVNIEYPGYGQAWYDRIVKETGDKYLVYPDSQNVMKSSAWSRKI